MNAPAGPRPNGRKPRPARPRSAQMLAQAEAEAERRRKRRRRSAPAGSKSPSTRERAPGREEDWEQDSDLPDLSGRWELSNRIEETNYPDYLGLRLGYHIVLEQDGDRLRGQGQKWSENGRSSPESQRTPITFTGSIEGDEVVLRFTEQGARRSSGGRFHWRLMPDGRRLRGASRAAPPTPPAARPAGDSRELSPSHCALAPPAHPGRRSGRA